MQVFPLRSLLVLVLIPLWPHQLIPWCFTVSYSQAFSIPFDFHSQIFFLLFQYFHHFTTVPWHHCHCKTLPSSPYLCGVNMMWSWHGWGWQPLQTDSQIQLRNRQRIWAHSYAVHQHMVGAIHSYTHTTWLRFWGSLQHVWACWYAVHWHTAAAFHSYTHTTWNRFWGSGSLVEEAKWCDYVMVEADSPFKLLPSSILDIYKVFEHIDMLSIGTQ